MMPERHWRAAIAEHEQVIGEMARAIGDVSPGLWHVPPRRGKWSPAAEALHVAVAYEFVRVTVTAGAAMQPLTSPAHAWLLRSIVLPLFLRARTFPRGAAAPQEVMPSLAEAAKLTPSALHARLDRAASEAARLLREAERAVPSPRVMHAYFGPLRPLTGLRLLSAHTRHHARRLRSGGAVGAASSG